MTFKHLHASVYVYVTCVRLFFVILKLLYDAWLLQTNMCVIFMGIALQLFFIEKIIILWFKKSAFISESAVFNNEYTVVEESLALEVRTYLMLTDKIKITYHNRNL